MSRASIACSVSVADATSTGPLAVTTIGRSPTWSTSDSPSSRTMAASRESTRGTHVSDRDFGRNALRH